MSYGSDFTDSEFYITTEPCAMLACELQGDIEDYFRARGFISLNNRLLHDAVYVVGDTYYPIFDNSPLEDYAYYDEDCQYIDGKLKADVISNKITKYRIIDLKRKVTVMQLDKVKGALDLFVINLEDEDKNWSAEELSSLYMIINKVRSAVC